MASDRISTEMLSRPAGTGVAAVQILQDSDWQMSFGERAAMEGLLSQLKPQLALEIGTAEGGSLARIAAHSAEVHSFDLVEPRPAARELGNVHFHTGDSHQLLPEILAGLADAGRNVDLVLVDGDHSTEGVRQDIEDLLESPAINHTIILIHDTMNELVRAGVGSVRYEAYPKVAYVELDLVPGYMFREPSLQHELWGGLGIVVTDATRGAYFAGGVRQRKYYEASELIRRARDLVVREEQEGLDWAAELLRTRQQLDQAIRGLDAVERSVSWRLTAPLRSVKRRLVGSRVVR